MAGRRTAAGLVLASVGLTAAGCLGAATKTVTAADTQTVTITRKVTTTESVTAAKPCSGTELAAMFSVVPNSAGAGQVAYMLTVKNSSHIACSLQGAPKATLLSETGTALPTHVKAERGRGRKLVLPPGASALAQARFSPDVAGDGDSQSGSCQPQAHTLELSAEGGGVAEAPIKPPTSVCEQGTLNFEAFSYAG
jgi:Protein of unknown function (DUF4232)